MEQLGQFRILGRIGAGGMGEVYRARDEKLERDVAIKVVPDSEFADATSRARLLREARSAAGLNHPNICVVHEVGEETRGHREGRRASSVATPRLEYLAAGLIGPIRVAGPRAPRVVAGLPGAFGQLLAGDRQRGVDWRDEGGERVGHGGPLWPITSIINHGIRTG